MLDAKVSLQGLCDGKLLFRGLPKMLGNVHELKIWAPEWLRLSLFNSELGFKLLSQCKESKDEKKGCRARSLPNPNFWKKILQKRIKRSEICMRSAQRFVGISQCDSFLLYRQNKNWKNAYKIMILVTPLPKSFGNERARPPKKGSDFCFFVNARRRQVKSDLGG